ncbi:MAG: hypothetical protein Q9N34_05455 [Aquificota bacterium]|nr:hypothetical protein [Aquificota bacterium]
MITALNNGTFELRGEHGMTFTVDYSQVSQQGIGIENLLVFAREKQLKVEVECSSINMNQAHCTASEIEVEVKGVVADTTNNVYTIQLDPDGSAIKVELEQGGEIEGNITSGTEVEAELVGEVNGVYMASEIEQES